MQIDLKFGAKIEPTWVAIGIIDHQYSISRFEKWMASTGILENQQLRDWWDMIIETISKLVGAWKSENLLHEEQPKMFPTDLTSLYNEFLTGYSQQDQSNGNREPMVAFKTTRKCKLVGKNVSKMCRVGIEPSRSQRSKFIIASQLKTGMTNQNGLHIPLYQ